VHDVFGSHEAQLVAALEDNAGADWDFLAAAAQ